VSRLLYIDTGAFVALLWARDTAHLSMSAHLRRLVAAGDRLITSEPVLSETVTRLRCEAGSARVAAFRSVLNRAVARGSLIVRESEDDLRRTAFDVLEQFADLRLSYADAVGAAIARERRVDAVFGLDHNFRVMGFAVEP
jgi:predicted nucleic acid-binding protein